MVNTIRESNRAMNHKLNNGLKQGQRRQLTKQVTPARNRASGTERGRLAFLILMKRGICTELEGSGHTWILHSKGR